MAIDYIKRTQTLTIECDVCGDEDVYIGSFKEGIEQAKADGWIIFKTESNSFQHLCSDYCARRKRD